MYLCICVWQVVHMHRPSRVQSKTPRPVFFLNGCLAQTPGGSNASRRKHLTRFLGGLVFKAHRWLYHTTLGSRVIKKKIRFP